MSLLLYNTGIPAKGDKEKHQKQLEMFHAFQVTGFAVDIWLLYVLNYL